LCTIARRWNWFRTWELRDADSRVVGTIASSNLRSSMGKPWILVNRMNTGDTVFCDGQGRALATLKRLGEKRLLSFKKDLTADPFVRMLLLGAALVGVGVD
jgi:hypothetical protein